MSIQGTEPYQYITPGCCNMGDLYIYTIYMLPYNKTKKWFKSNPPQWWIRRAAMADGMFSAQWEALGLNKLGHDEAMEALCTSTNKPVQFCPWCGKTMPALKLINPRIKIGINDDDYCKTCKKRNGECQCPRPELMWGTDG